MITALFPFLGLALYIVRSDVKTLWCGIVYQVANNLGGGTGQLIGNTAYLIQQGVETEGMLARASPQAVSAVSILFVVRCYQVSRFYPAFL